MFYCWVEKFHFVKLSQKKVYRHLEFTGSEHLILNPGGMKASVAKSCRELRESSRELSRVAQE